MYELTVDQEHINLIKKALQSYLCSIYDGLDNEVLDVAKAHEDIKVLSDMLAVLKGQNGYRQTSESVCLMWIKEIVLDQPVEVDLTKLEVKRLDRDVAVEDMFSQHNDENLQYTNKVLQQAWNNVKERHWDTIKRIGDK